MRLDAAAWSVFDGFEPRAGPRWDAWSDLDRLEEAAAGAVAPAVRRAKAACVRWEERLAPLGMTPSDLAWASFRPLRLAREEDWSDWLAFLLTEAPPTVRLALLGTEGPCGRARRELQAGDFRADLVLDLGASRVSVEVKLQDRGLAKTFDCCAKLEAQEPGAWRHFILLPEEREAEWRDLLAARALDGRPSVDPVTWTQVALALRGGLWRREGSVAWRCWALAFCGAIEQVVMGLPAKADLEARSFSHDLSSLLRWSDHLEAGMGDDRERP